MSTDRNTIDSIDAIDVHGHYGLYYRAQKSALLNSFSEGDVAIVLERAHKAHTVYTVVSPLLGLMPRGKSDPVSGNMDAQRVVRDSEGILQWVIIDPATPETYKQAEEMLSDSKCVGIKIHPEEHLYPIRDHGRAIFEFAQQYEAVILLIRP